MRGREQEKVFVCMDVGKEQEIPEAKDARAMETEEQLNLSPEVLPTISGELALDDQNMPLG